MAISSFLLCMYLYISTKPAILITVYFFINDVWQDVKARGITETFLGITDDESLVMQKQSLDYLHSFHIRSLITKDRIHTTKTFKVLSLCLPQHLRGTFVFEGWALSQSENTTTAIVRLQAFIGKYQPYQKLNGKMNLFRSKNAIKKTMNWMKQIDPDKILRALAHDDSNDIEHNHEDLNCLFNRNKNTNIYDGIILLKGQLQRNHAMYYSTDYSPSRRPDLAKIKYMRMLERLDKATCSSYIKGSLHKWRNRLHGFRRKLPKEIDVSLLSKTPSAVGKEIKMRYFSSICHETRIINVFYPGNHSKTGYLGKVMDSYCSNILRCVGTAGIWRDNYDTVCQMVEMIVNDTFNDTQAMDLSIYQSIHQLCQTCRKSEKFLDLKNLLFYDEYDMKDAYDHLKCAFRSNHTKLMQYCKDQNIVIDMELFEKIESSVAQYSALPSAIGDILAQQSFIISKYDDVIYLVAGFQHNDIVLFVFYNIDFTKTSINKVHYPILSGLCHSLFDAISFHFGYNDRSALACKSLFDFKTLYKALEFTSDEFIQFIVMYLHDDPNIKRVLGGCSMTFANIKSLLIDIQDADNQMIIAVVGAEIDKRMRKLRARGIKETKLLREYHSSFAEYDALKIINPQIIVRASSNVFQEYVMNKKNTVQWILASVQSIVSDTIKWGALSITKRNPKEIAAAFDKEDDTKSAQKQTDSVKDHFLYNDHEMHLETATRLSTDQVNEKTINVRAPQISREQKILNYALTSYHYTLHLMQHVQEIQQGSNPQDMIPLPCI
eukprot:861101_1